MHQHNAKRQHSHRSGAYFRIAHHTRGLFHKSDLRALRVSTQIIVACKLQINLGVLWGSCTLMPRSQVWRLFWLGKCIKMSQRKRSCVANCNLHVANLVRRAPGPQIADVKRDFIYHLFQLQAETNTIPCCRSFYWLHKSIKPNINLRLKWLISELELVICYKW